MIKRYLHGSKKRLAAQPLVVPNKCQIVISRSSVRIQQAICCISDDVDEKKKTETVLATVSKEQEEIWKALHSLYDTQSEKISLVINSTESTREFMNQLRANVELSLSKLSVRIDDIMVDLNVLTGKYERVAKEMKSIEREDTSSVDTNTLQAVQAEVNQCKKEVANMKKETLDIIKGHDDIIVSKLKAYSTRSMTT